MNFHETVEINCRPASKGPSMGRLRRFNVVSPGSSDDMLREVKTILKDISPDFDTRPVESAFETVAGLYQGRWPDYRSCNTDYHDLGHTVKTFLAMARLAHGAVVSGETFTNRAVALSLISALLHDVGYIQEKDDLVGTGAKYTAVHVQRSIDFLKRHGSEFDLSDKEISACGAMILCTDLSTDIAAIVFESDEIELLGKMLACADILAQMADRAYLEKLLLLYHELEEGGMTCYKDEVDLLHKTTDFYDFIDQRLETALDATNLHMGFHYVSKYGVWTNPYDVAIENQRKYLHNILKIPNTDPRDHLKRGGIVSRIRKRKSA